MITKGEWTAIRNTAYWHISILNKNGEYIEGVGDVAATKCNSSYESKCVEQESNAKLIATAGTVANKLYDMGYDGQAAIEALPEILDALINLHTKLDNDISLTPDDNNQTGWAILKAKG